MSLRELFCGLTDEEFAQVVRDVQMGRISWPIVVVIEKAEEVSHRT